MPAAATAAPNRIVAREFFTSNWRSSRSAREQFVGTWKLLSWKIKQADGELIDSPMGPDALGWIMYQPGGQMSVALMRLDRPKFASNNLMEGTPEEIKVGFEGYLGYCGSYEINERECFIIHHLQLSSFPNWLGTDQKRYFEFTANRLTLSTPPLTLVGAAQVHRLIWERVE